MINDYMRGAMDEYSESESIIEEALRIIARCGVLVDAEVRERVWTMLSDDVSADALARAFLNALLS